MNHGVNLSWIVDDPFSRLLGLSIVESVQDRVVVQMPYQEVLGASRIHGGAISTLMDTAATAAFWSHPELGSNARGATVSLNISFLRLAVATDLSAEAIVRRRGGTLCTGEVKVQSEDGNEVAIATVIYKLTAG